ncbi:hypothetical protein KM043_006748 [Ampulex compressa]|nr:hypothetical protein KM043_006748 [Ampulex compressa]
MAATKRITSRQLDRSLCYVAHWPSRTARDPSESALIAPQNENSSVASEFASDSSLCRRRLIEVPSSHPVDLLFGVKTRHCCLKDSSASQVYDLSDSPSEERRARHRISRTNFDF